MTDRINLECNREDATRTNAARGLVQRPLCQMTGKSDFICVAFFHTTSYSQVVHSRYPALPLSQTKESVCINIRTKARQRDLIDHAADQLGRSRSEFMLDAACREAEDVLLDQTCFTVDATTFAKFQKRLDRPLPPTDKVRRLLKTNAPWEK
jgi:uncharacterized protein (DUF1778 family)